MNGELSIVNVDDADISTAQYWTEPWRVRRNEADSSTKADKQKTKGLIPLRLSNKMEIFQTFRRGGDGAKIKTNKTE